jgi:hypothetical protein
MGAQQDAVEAGFVSGHRFSDAESSNLLKRLQALRRRIELKS